MQRAHAPSTTRTFPALATGPLVVPAAAGA